VAKAVLTGANEADGEKSAAVVLISAATARRFWPGENPIGKHVKSAGESQWRTVVGVAGDVRQFRRLARSHRSHPAAHRFDDPGSALSDGKRGA
jgi:hypothetical protein